MIVDTDSQPPQVSHWAEAGLVPPAAPVRSSRNRPRQPQVQIAGALPRLRPSAGVSLRRESTIMAGVSRRGCHGESTQMSDDTCGVFVRDVAGLYPMYRPALPRGLIDPLRNHMHWR